MRTNALRYDPTAGRLVWVDVVSGEAVAGEPPSEVPDLSAEPAGGDGSRSSARATGASSSSTP